ncbi:hypothetical protein LUZ60_007858 [Juncus effusus]|nr:hypothetical protein LUZ60_007858 [Juncus effusus]
MPFAPPTYSPDVDFLQAPANQAQLAASSNFRPVNFMNQVDMAGPSSFNNQAQMMPMKRPRLMETSFRCPSTVCGNFTMGAAVTAPVSQMNNGFSSFPSQLPLSVNADLTGFEALNQTRLENSGFPSTSGRQGSIGLGDEISSIFNQIDSDAEKLISLETQRIRIAMEEERKRFYRVIMAEFSKGPVMHWLIQKKSELEEARRKNSELEQKLHQINAENQAWINIAKNNEAIVASLRAQVEQAANNGNQEKKLEEGSGDTDEIQSKLSFWEDSTRVKKQDQYMCRVCGANDAIKLVLPCRHLSLCDWCDMAVLGCPTCGEPKLSSVPVKLS